MPSSARGLVGWAIASLIMVAFGLFILSRVRPIWALIMPPQG